MGRKQGDMNIRKFLNAENAPNEEYAKCFLYFDKYNQEHFTSYKLQLVDVIDGGLQIIPNAVKTALETGVSFIPYQEQELAHQTLRNIDERIEEQRVKAKHEIKSLLQKCQTTNQVMKLWRQSDNASLHSNDMRDSILDAMRAVCTATLEVKAETSTGNQDRPLDLHFAETQTNNDCLKEKETNANDCENSQTEADSPSESTLQAKGILEVKAYAMQSIASIKEQIYKNL